MSARLACVALFACAGTACGPQPDTSASGPSGPYARTAVYSREHAGRGLIVMQNGAVVFQDDENGFTVDTPTAIFSGTKSFDCALVNVAIQDGLLTSLDENVSATITEWASDPLKSQITVRQLLNFTSGLSQSLLNLLAIDTDEYSFVASVPAVAQPGTTFQYGETSITVFAELMRRKLVAAPAPYTGMDALAYLDARIFVPIGLQYAFWQRNAQGLPFMSFGATVSAREWIKYGQLIAAGGQWNGQTVVPNVSQCLTGSGPMPGYGMNVWLNAPMPASFQGIALSAYTVPDYLHGGPGGLIDQNGPSDLFAFNGTGSNRTYVAQSLGILIVRTAQGSVVSDWDDAAFLDLALHAR